MASEVDICNLALSHLGDDANVISIHPPDQSVQAQLCSSLYPMARNALFDEHNWSFTTKRVTLAELTPETLEYEYCYAAPSDLLNIIALRNAFQQRASIDGTASAMRDEYSMEVNSAGLQVIYCHFANAELIYNANAVDPGKFPPLFVNALGWLLASYLAGPLLKGDVGASAAVKMLQGYSQALSKAISSDSQNRKANRRFVPEAIRARQGFTTLETGVSSIPVSSSASSSTSGTSGTSTPPPSADTTAPSKVTGLSAAPSSAHQIDLSWEAATDNVQLAGYKVYRNNIEIATVTGLTYSDTGLSSSTSYSYFVAAIDTSNNLGLDSDTAIATTFFEDLVAPTVPTNLTATAVSSTAINLSWVASSDNIGVAGYRIFRNGIQIATTQATVYADTGLSPSNLYSYTVSAYDNALNVSNASTAATATTDPAADTTKPTAPTNLVATAISSSRIDLTWTASTDDRAVTGYRVYRNGVLVGSNVTTTSYSDFGLTGSTLYSYQVEAFDAANNISDLSAGANATTSAPVDTTAPTVPANLTATTFDNDRIDLAWDASTDAVGVTGYRVYRAGVAIADTASTSYSNTGLTGSTNYVYTVAAFDAAGNISAQSASANDTTDADPDTTAPSVPTLLTASAVSATQINLSWTASTDNVAVTGYKIFRNGVQIGTSAGTTFNNTGLTASSTYTYTIAAYDAVGNTSAQTNPVQATTQVATNHPKGLYSLDSVVNKAFVSGVLKRVGWDVLEITQGVYDFSPIDSILQQAANLNQKVTLAVFAVRPPTYVKNGASQTFNAGTYGVQPVPWDSFAQGRWLAFCQALAAHSFGGFTLPNHPTLANIDCSIIGSQGIRLLGLPPGYTLQLYKQAVLDSVGAIADRFPNKNCYTGLFGISGIPSYPNGASDCRNIRDALLAKYDGIANTRMNFYQETLTGAAPTTNTGSSGAFMDEVKNQTDIMLQMCWSYTQKLAAGTGTQCTWEATPHPSLAKTRADVFLSKYIEVYNDDLNSATYASTFTSWAAAIA